MTWRAFVSSGAGTPTSTPARWIAPAISAAESASVPSQSKASNRKRRGGSGIGRPHRIEGVEKSAELRRQGGLEIDRALFQRVGESDLPRVQEHPLQALLGQHPVPGKIAILFVARELEPKMRQMHPDLMRASRMELCFEQAYRRVDVGPDPPPVKHSLRVLAPLLLDANAALAAAGEKLGERQGDLFPRLVPLSLDQDLVALVDSPVAQRRVEPDQRGAFFGNQQNTRCIAVEPMHEFQKLCIRPSGAQLFYQTEGDAATAVHGEPGGLVDRDQGIVLVQHRNRRRKRRRLARSWCRQSGSDRRDSELVS